MWYRFRFTRVAVLFHRYLPRTLVAALSADERLDTSAYHLENIQALLRSYHSHLPGLIEAGFDIINPVQINAKDMDSRRLKEEFGSRLTFWGGGVDTQKILPFGTPDEIRRHVKEQCEILGRDGGFVFNAVHNIQANVPVENVVAMFDALKDFR